MFSGNTKSCGCVAREIQHNKALDIIGKRFGRLTVIKESEDSEPYNVRMLCRCDCGTEKSISVNDLRTGMTKSCGCYRKENTKELCTEDLTGMVFNELTAIKQVNNFIGRTGKQRVQWLFKCSCGREIIALPMNVKRGFTKSCGHIGNSYAECKIFDILKENHIPFEHNICPFDDLVNPETNHKLSLDFVITKPDNSKIVIEHQGEQHFYNESNRGDSNFGKLQREVTDGIKREYFLKRNIPFYETRYDQDYISEVKNILTYHGFTIS